MCPPYVISELFDVSNTIIFGTWIEQLKLYMTTPLNFLKVTKWGRYLPQYKEIHRKFAKIMFFQYTVYVLLIDQSLSYLPQRRTIQSSLFVMVEISQGHSMGELS